MNKELTVVEAVCLTAAGIMCFYAAYRVKHDMNILQKLQKDVEDFKEKRHKDLEDFKEARKRELIRCEKIEEFMKETDEDKAKGIIVDFEEMAKEDAKMKEDLEEHKRKAKENIEFLRSLRKEN